MLCTSGHASWVVVDSAQRVSSSARSVNQVLPLRPGTIIPLRHNNKGSDSSSSNANLALVVVAAAIAVALVQHRRNRNRSEAVGVRRRRGRRSVRKPRRLFSFCGLRNTHTMVVLQTIVDCLKARLKALQDTCRPCATPFLTDLRHCHDWTQTSRKTIYSFLQRSQKQGFFFNFNAQLFF